MSQNSTTTSTSSAKELEKDVRVGIETDPAKDYEARENIKKARIGLLIREPFFGTLAVKLKPVNADKWLPTAATDGRRLYYNSEFLAGLSPKQVQFVFGHEVLHCVYDHFGRRGSRDPKLANIAADYCVNQDLINHQIGEKPSDIGILYDQKYDGYTFEQVYDDLFQNMQQLDLDQLADMLLDDHMEDEGQNGDGGTDSNGNCPQCGEPASGGNNDGDGEGGDDDGENRGGNGGKSGHNHGNGNNKCDHPCHHGNGRPKPLTQEEKEQIRDEFKQSVLAAASACNSAGSIPAGVQRMIKEMTESRMDWRELLEIQIKSTIKSNFAWTRPNRKAQHSGFVLPGMITEEMIDIVVAIDTSGSVDDDMLKDFMSEIKGIMDQYVEFKIKVMCFDSEVHNVQDFTADTMDDFVYSYIPEGGGGTTFGSVYEYLEDNGIDPMKMVFFTDGYPCDGWPTQAPAYAETVFIIHTDNVDHAPVPEDSASFAYYERGVKGGVS